jgi:DNA-binding GntR family transcriptional regulator
VPRLTFPGGALLGCSAGFVNVPRIKGSHNAILSGIQAADAVVAELASDAQLAELASLHARLEDAVTDADAFFAANERFHMRLLEIADNRWRNQMVADMRQVMKLNRHHSLLKEGRLAASLKEHRDLMAALEARDPVRAKYLMHLHMAQGKEAAAFP